jgi:hypothetical protein
MYSCPRAKRGAVVPRCMGHKLHIRYILEMHRDLGNAQESAHVTYRVEKHKDNTVI